MPRCFMAKKLKYPYQQWKASQEEPPDPPPGHLQHPSDQTDTGTSSQGSFFGDQDSEIWPRTDTVGSEPLARPSQGQPFVF